jgi:acyl dehydratase
MPIDPDVAIGAWSPDKSFSWSSSDVLLYHLGIGAGSRPGDNTDPRALRLTLDDDKLQVLPSFAVVVPTFRDDKPPFLDIPGCDLDLRKILHGSQEVVVHRPVPTSGSATLRTRVADVWDKGTAAVIVQEGTALSASGEQLWTVRSSIYVRDEGGFGGARGSSTRVELPARAADAESSYDVMPQQALLYRLCGDRNPLHADPSFAREAGFPAPILHGLCTYGITLREVTELLLEGDPARVGGFAARFAGVVFPGDTIRVRAWDEGERILVSATVDDRPVLADCVLTRT